MRGDLQDDGLAAAGNIADVDPGCVGLPRPQVVQRPAGGRVGGVVNQLGQLGVLTCDRPELFSAHNYQLSSYLNNLNNLNNLTW